MQTHQSNYRRLQELRTASASLDAQIKDTLRLLANTRKELVSTPATVFPEDRPYYRIKYDELLRYARMISKTTIPPAGIANGGSGTADIPAVPTADSSLGNPPDAGATATTATETAATTPAAAAAAATPNGVQSNGTQPAGHSTEPDAASSSVAATPAGTTATAAGGNGDSANANNTNAHTTLPEQLTAHLNPHLQMEFAPWPTEDGVRGGSLAALAFLADRGVDPEGYDPEERARREQEQEEERRAREDREDRERKAREEQQAARLRADLDRQRALQRDRQQAADEEARRRGSAADGAAPAPAAPASSPVAAERKQFQFITSFDDDDD